MNFTARNVIIPAKHLRANEIELGYTTFLELYKLEIISVLEKMYGLPPAEVWAMWQRATVNFDERVYKVMEYIINRGDAIVEINRNPNKMRRTRGDSRGIHSNSGDVLILTISDTLKCAR